MSLTAPVAHDPAARDLTDVGVATLDLGLHLMHANDEFLGQLGRASDEVYGRHIGGLLDPSVQSSLLPQFDHLATGRVSWFTGSFLAPQLGARSSSGRMTALAGRGGNGVVEAIVLLVRAGAERVWARQTVSRQRQLSQLDALVLEGVAAGRSTVRLAGDLYLSRQGVEYHVGSMLRRYHSPNRPAQVAKAYAQGVLVMGQWPPKVPAEYVR